MTIVTLPVVSLIPEATEREPRALVGHAYAGLTELERIILMLAHRFGDVRNSDVQPYRCEHPREIGDRLKYLVDHDGQRRDRAFQASSHSAWVEIRQVERRRNGRTRWPNQYGRSGRQCHSHAHRRAGRCREVNPIKPTPRHV